MTENVDDVAETGLKATQSNTRLRLHCPNSMSMNVKSKQTSKSRTQERISLLSFPPSPRTTHFQPKIF